MNMKIYKYNQPDSIPPSFNIEVVMNEQEILNEYYSYWSTRMLKVGRSPFITEQNCIQDWIVVHWAWEINE